MENGIYNEQLQYPGDDDQQFPTEISDNIKFIDANKQQYLYANFVQNEGNISIIIEDVAQTFKQLIDIVKNKAYKFYILKDSQRFNCIKYIDYIENETDGQLIFLFSTKENNNIIFKRIIISSLNGEDILYITYSEGMSENMNNKVTLLDEHSTDDQFPSAKLVYEFTNDLINEVAVYYITKNSSGDPFATKAELDSTTTFYSGGVVRVPTRNDYCIVKKDETHNNSSCRYTRQGNAWEFQIEYDKNYTEKQNQAINSGITEEKIEKYDNILPSISADTPEMKYEITKITQQENNITNNIVNLVKFKKQRYPILGVSGTNYGEQANTFDKIKYIWFGKESEKPDSSIQALYKNTIFTSYVPLPKYLCFEAEEANSTINSNLLPGTNIEYSFDKVTWINGLNKTVVLTNIGDIVYYRGTNNRPISGSSHHFQMTGKIKASGSIMRLVNGKQEIIDIPSAYMFGCLFYNCISLTKAPDLPAVNLAENCYMYMFCDCISLTKAPDLPAINLAVNCYSNMFNECTSLIQAPELPAVNLAENCYYGMFQGCTSLIQAPELPAVNLAISCYDGMFALCTSLTKAPELPAVNLAENCYRYMFYYCTSLTKAPDLPAINLAVNCYSNMFCDCISLTKAPDLPAVNLAENCYMFMFNECTSLTQAPELPAVNLAENCYYGMFQGCTSLIQAPELPAVNLAENCYSNMFYYCTSLTKAPDLPAINLAVNCYMYMFYYCTSLTKAPELPAVNLAENCYRYMFCDCISLNYIKIHYTGEFISYFNYWVLRISSTGNFYYNGSDTTRGNSAIPEGWTVHTF